LIGLAVVAERPDDAAAGAFNAPWFNPGAHAFFKVGDDLAGNAGVDVGFYGLGHGSGLLFGPGLHGVHATLAVGETGGSKVKDERRGGGSPGLHKTKARKAGDTPP